jgi:hypothetical protein
VSSKRRTNGIPVRLMKATVERVDGVDGPASEVPFLMIKSAVVPGDEEDETTDGTDGTGGLADDAAAASGGESTDGTEGAAPVESGETPGDSAWEKQDAANAAKAAALIATLKGQVGDLIAREKTEDETADVYDLTDAQCALDWVLGVLAKLSFSEGADSDTAADAAKNGDQAADDTAGAAPADEEEAAVSKSAMIQEVTDAVTATLSAQLGEVRKAVEALQPSAPADTQTSTETAATVADPVVKQSDTDVSEVLKSTLPQVLEPVTKAVGQLAEQLADVSGRLAAVEAQDAQGGPMLKGAQPQQLLTSHLWGQGPSVDPYAAHLAGGLATPEALTKAVSQITDAQARDSIGKQIATAMHPLFTDGH